MDTSNIIERAFALARSGNFSSNEDIYRQLKAEGFSSIPSHFAGAGIRKQLIAMRRAAAPPKPAAEALDAAE